MYIQEDILQTWYEYIKKAKKNGEKREKRTLRVESMRTPTTNLWGIYKLFLDSKMIEIRNKTWRKKIFLSDLGLFSLQILKKYLSVSCSFFKVSIFSVRTFRKDSFDMSW